MVMLERVRTYVGSLPYIRYQQAEKLEKLIKENNLRQCIELGFYHGVSSAYIAEILKDNGGGHLIAIDKAGARERVPNIDQVLGGLCLTDYVTVYYEPSSYTWRLMKLLEENEQAVFDFCYFDGGHTWDNTGFAFLLVDRLLKRGGWIVFDDLDWTLERQSPRPRKPDEEITTPQVRKVWELLVKRHAGYHGFTEEGQWGWAQKRC